MTPEEQEEIANFSFALYTNALSLLVALSIYGMYEEFLRTLPSAHQQQFV